MSDTPDKPEQQEPERLPPAIAVAQALEVLEDNRVIDPMARKRAREILRKARS
jgi:hypothetical protein